MVVAATKSVAVIILTKNERLHIERAMRSVEPFARVVFVVDSGSTDGTAELAQQLGAEVRLRSWKNYADQFQWAVDNIQTDAEWVMRLDADEIVEPQLAQALCTRLAGLPDDVSGIVVNRKHIFMGRWIRHGGRYPLKLLRVFRRGRGRIEQRWMDEHLIVRDGGTVFFPGDIVDHNLNGLSFFTDKHNSYATREAVDTLIAKYDLMDPESIGSVGGTPRQAIRRRRIKEKIYNAIPFHLSATAYFWMRYLFQLGILDGREGFAYHFLQGYWYRMLAGVKTVEFDKEVSKQTDKVEMRRTLSRLSGLDLGP